MKIDNVWFKFKNINEEKGVEIRADKPRSVPVYYTIEEIRNVSAVCNL